MMTTETENAIKRFMAQKLASGETSLSEIQKEVNAEFKLKLTYMEIRILASELEDIDWRKGDPNQPKPAAETKPATAPAGEAGEGSFPEDDGFPAEEGAADDAVPPMPGESAAAAPGGKAVVELSKLARPGMMLSGTVTFPSGSTAEWYVDQMGRLGLENLKGEKPNAADIQAFQIELDRVVRQAMG